MNLHLASGLHLPVDAATQTFLVVGKRGSGKSSTGTRLAEQLIQAHVPIAVLDPVDVWWGLKAGQDGKPAGGVGIYVFGGDHADLPLEPTAGVLMADVLVDHRVSAIFVLRTFSNRDKARFVADFAEQLFKRNREVLHLFAEEAHELMPQQPYRGEEEMLGRMLRLQKLGRTSGIGVTCITQRPASLNKNATTQAEILVAHRILGPQDRDAIEGWIKHHRQDEHKKEVLTTLPELKTGEAWIWAPDFPEEKPLGLRRVKVVMPETFDSRRTPKPGEKRVQPKALASVDLEKLRSKMAATIERAKADDPRELRRRIVELERINQGLTTRKVPVSSQDIKRVEIDVVKPAMMQRIEQLVRKIEQVVQSADRIQGALAKAAAPLGTVVVSLGSEAARLSAALRATPAPSVSARTALIREQQATRPIGRPMAIMVSRRMEQSGLSGPEQRILDAIAWCESIGIQIPTQTAVAFLAGYTYGAGAFNNPRGKLRAAGHVEYLGSDRIRLTESGRAAAAVPAMPLTIDELHRRVLDRLPTPAQRILRPLLEAYPKALTKDELAERAGYTAGAGAFNNPMGRLRSLGLIDYPAPGQAVASPVLFLEGNSS